MSMSDELAGFGVPDFLPLATRKALRAEEARERREAREAEAEREAAVEARRSADLAMYKEQAEQRGETVSAMALATGQVSGRSVGDVLAGAAAMADIEDARAEARRRRQEEGPLNFADAPPATRAMSPEEREVWHLTRHYADDHPGSDVVDRAVMAREARKALRQNRRLI